MGVGTSRPNNTNELKLAVSILEANTVQQQQQQLNHQTHRFESSSSSDRVDNSGSDGGKFRMPLHYPRYKKSDYETMPEWKLDYLLDQYGMSPVLAGDLDSKRNFAMGAFLWPSQYNDDQTQRVNGYGNNEEEEDMMKN